MATPFSLATEIAKPWQLDSSRGRLSGSQAETEANPDSLVADKAQGALCCCACSHPVTHREERIEINGLHEHVQINPHGFEFRFGCFRRADGCAARGDAVEEHSWFSGYGWRVAVCRRCGLHLGWRFDSDTPRVFYGLILDRLVSLQ